MNQSVLYVLAEVAMTLAGFSGFVAAFRLRGKNAWSPTELRVLWFLIIDSFLVVFLALLPVILYLFSVSHHLVWGTSSLVLGAWFVIGNLLAFQGERRERAKKQLVRVPVITRLFYAMTGIAIAVAGCLWLSAFDILLPRGQAVYTSGLMILLAFAFIEFLFFIAQASAAHSKEE